MSIPPPPPAGRQGLGPAAAWLLALLIIGATAVAIVAMLTFGGENGSDGDGSLAASGSPSGEEVSPPPPAEETGPSPGTPLEPPGETPGPTEGHEEGSGMAIGALSIPSVPVSMLLAACAQADPARALPDGAKDRSTLRADFDGDAEADVFSVYRDPASGSWYVRMDVSWGFSAEIPLEGAWGTAEMNRIVRFGDTLTALVFTSFADDPGAYRFFSYRDCGVQEITPGGDPLIVGTVVPLIFPDIPPEIGGFACATDAVVVTRATYVGQAGLPTHTVTSRTYSWDEESGAFLPGPEVTVAACCDWPGQQEVIEGAGTFDCPGGMR